MGIKLLSSTVCVGLLDSIAWPRNGKSLKLFPEFQNWNRLELLHKKLIISVAGPQVNSEHWLIQYNQIIWLIHVIYCKTFEFSLFTQNHFYFAIDNFQGKKLKAQSNKLLRLVVQVTLKLLMSKVIFKVTLSMTTTVI